MPANLSMPRLSDTMEVGTIVKWHVKPGQKVKSGEVIADIETDKATMELQTFDDGVVAELAVTEGQSCPVGTTILRFEGGSDASARPGAKPAANASAAGSSSTSSSNASSTATLTPPGARATPTPGSPRDTRGSEASNSDPARATMPRSNPNSNGNAAHSTNDRAGDRIFISPLARKIAAEENIDLARLEGSGPSGRIVRKDVETFLKHGGQAEHAEVHAAANGHQPSSAGTPANAAARPAPLDMPPAIPLEARSIPLSNMRRVIAGRLVESKTTIPHYQVTVAVRMDALLALREQLNTQLAQQGVKLSVNDFIVRACALAMHQHPFINARWNPTGPAIDIQGRVNIGIAISLPIEKGGGLVVATLRDADRKGLRSLSAETKALADKARTRGLTLDEMADSTFTISNLGMFAVEHFTAIINPPNTAILAVGAALKKPVVATSNGRDELTIGHEMQMTMSSDHRVIDGAMAAQYLGTVKQMLEAPATLLV
ncbi:pyruvate dehydrogenase complex dihydrolipoamide acetyltransferase [soil metagenome]